MKSAIKNITITLFLSLFLGLFFYFLKIDTVLNFKVVKHLIFWMITAVLFSIPSLLLVKVLDYFFPWDNFKNRMLLTITTNFVLLLVLAVLLSYGEYLIENEYNTIKEYTVSNGGRIRIGMYFIIALLFSFFFHAKGFYTALIDSKKREIELLEARKEIELSVLNAQIDPHFLFNNLNVLNALIEENQERAQEFVIELANVYRYVLEVKDNETVSLSEEIDFAKEYFNLLQKRFERAIVLKIGFIDLTKKIVPLTLQTALENVIKHNNLTEENPLTIRLFEKENYLYIVNNSQNKKVKNSSKEGLKNLIKRYELQDGKLEVEETKKSFILKVSLFN